MEGSPEIVGNALYHVAQVEGVEPSGRDCRRSEQKPDDVAGDRALAAAVAAMADGKRDRILERLVG